MDVLITGANRGIGKALFDLYKADGVDIAGTARQPAAGSGLIGFDVTDPDAADRLGQTFAGQSLPLLICNAGVYLDSERAHGDRYAPAIWAETFAVNVTGVWLTISALLPALRAAKGKIAILSSIMASDTRAPGGSYAYRASKAAALNLGRNLAADLRADGIAVGIYHPGWVRTEMGGRTADIEPEAAAEGLAARFAALSLATTGVFEDWRGGPVLRVSAAPLPFAPAPHMKPAI